MLPKKVHKKEGFEGQKAIVIPRNILSTHCAKNNVISSLYITDIGYYPKAEFHYRTRASGADQHILIYCHEGCGKAIIKGEHYSVEQGEFIIVPMKQPHIYQADENNPWTIYWSHFKGPAADGIVSMIKTQNNSFKGFIGFSEYPISLFNEIYSQLERGYSNDNLLYANMSFWHFLVSIAFNSKLPGAIKTNGKDDIDIAIDYLTERVDQTLTLEDVAAAVNLSASHFSYVFKRKTGFSPIEYFNHLKIQKACQYLLFTNLRIKEIGNKIGIDDPYYFSRMFTKVMGMSPKEYKDKRHQ
jgi:AraC-like DNA-binding protein/quercetin dioxygenase-like cupin family protein